jgi:hypothetical protein
LIFVQYLKKKNTTVPVHGPMYFFNNI